MSQDESVIDRETKPPVPRWWVTELRTHEQGLVGEGGAIGVQMDYLTPASAESVPEDPPSA